MWGRCVNFVCAKVLEFVCAKVLNLCGCGRRAVVWAAWTQKLGGCGWPVPWAVRCAVGQGFVGSDWRVSPLHILKDPLAVIALHGSRTLTKSPYLSRTLWLSAHHTFCVRVLTAAAE